MCYFLTIASPLTLSEVRSMLPPGLAAQPLDPAGAAEARRVLPATQTAAALLVGACSCDLVRPRDPDARVDERHLRARYARLGLGREEIIRRLERHRRRPARTQAESWGPPLAAFVAEHARNAGVTLYTLVFGSEPHAAGFGAAPVTRTVAQVREHPDGWLEEGRSVLVVR